VVVARVPAVDVVDRALAPWWEAIRSSVGPLRLYDAHTHIGFNDPDGYRQSAPELLAGLEPLNARAVVFPMHEPDGYPPANDAVLAAAEVAPDRLVAFCRIDPRAGALAEARRCLDAGARGIKLHPRAEGFALTEPAVERLFVLAGERRVPLLIHAGRGIPALGEQAVQLASRHPDARLILAHAAVSDLGWLQHEMPRHPNLFIDTSWWSPGDMMALFTLVHSGQVLWASDSPYTMPLTAAALHMRFAIQAGVGVEGLRSIAGEQLERILSGAETVPIGRPSGELKPPGPHHQRVVAHLLAAIGAALYSGDRSEPIALARLSCEVGDDPAAALLSEVARLLDLAERLAPDEPPEPRYPRSVRLLVAAMTLARTPAAPTPPAWR